MAPTEEYSSSHQPKALKPHGSLGLLVPLYSGVPYMDRDHHCAAKSQPPLDSALPVLHQALPSTPGCPSGASGSFHDSCLCLQQLVLSSKASLPQSVVVMPTCQPGLPPEEGLSPPWFLGLGWTQVRGQPQWTWSPSGMTLPCFDHAGSGQGREPALSCARASHPRI